MRIHAACLMSWMAALGASHVHAQDACDARALGTLGGTHANANDLNDWGQVVGSSGTTGDSTSHAFLWERGQMVDLGALDPASFSDAQAINEWGTVVGYSREPNGPVVPVVWSRRTIARLPLEGRGVAVDINNRGQIIGNSDGTCLLWEDRESEPISLGTLGGTYCSARAINDAGVVVGSAEDAQGRSHAFVWRDGVMTQAETLDVPPFVYVLSELSDINNKGLAVGRVALDGQFQPPFVWTAQAGGRFLDIENALPSSVNDWGVIALVQGYQDARLVLSDKDGKHTVVGELGGTVNLDALALNNRFQLAWTALDEEASAYRAYICQLTPPR